MHSMAEPITVLQLLTGNKTNHINYKYKWFGILNGT